MRRGLLWHCNPSVHHVLPYEGTPDHFKDGCFTIYLPVVLLLICRTHVCRNKGLELYTCVTTFDSNWVDNISTGWTHAMAVPSSARALEISRFPGQACAHALAVKHLALSCWMCQQSSDMGTLDTCVVGSAHVKGKRANQWHARIMLFVPHPMGYQQRLR